MRIEPAQKTFYDIYQKGQAQVVWSHLIADLETPVSAMLKLSRKRHHCFLLESVEGGVTRGRYSIIGLEPDIILRSHGEQAEINRSVHHKPEAFEPLELPTLQAIRDLIAESRIQIPEDLPPMSAGVFGYLGYDIVRQMEVLGEPNVDVLHVPDCIMIRPTIIVIFDTVKNEIIVVTPVRPDDNLSADISYTRAIERLTQVVDILEAPFDHSLDNMDTPLPLSEVVSSNISPDGYLAMVAKAKDYIAAGDIFQVVLSQRFETPFELPPFALYRALRRTNPAPFLFFFDFDDFAVVGSSPEILVRVRDKEVTVRPIAGTRPRGHTRAQDRANSEDLLNDPKERAEHLMLLDLGRNDVGRVSEIGSVQVSDQFFLEYYSHVMHIVSNVVGKLDTSRFDALDALSAGFPAGTVSGAPKIRAMQIIDELEEEKRGIYAGCVGYFSANGEMDTCIVLRTAIVKDGVMYVQAGAGIVADSDPQSEQQECVNKAQALFKAAEEAIRFAHTARKKQ